jgi:hypothetical protein
MLINLETSEQVACPRGFFISGCVALALSLGRSIAYTAPSFVAGRLARNEISNLWWLAVGEYRTPSGGSGANEAARRNL